MNYVEFKKTVFYTTNKMILPLLGRISVDKNNFMNSKKTKYDFNKEDDFLRELYEKNKHRLK